MSPAAEESSAPKDTSATPGFCGRLKEKIDENAERQREARTQRQNTPQPWILRKLAVFIVFGILGYTYYVYVVRFCIVMIRKKSSAVGSRAQGGKLFIYLQVR